MDDNSTWLGGPSINPSFFGAFERGLLTPKEYALLKDYCNRIGKDVYWSWKYSSFAHGHPYLEETAAYPKPNVEEERLLVFLAQQGFKEAQGILARFHLRYVIKSAVVSAYFKAGSKNIAPGLREENFEEYVGLGQLAVAEVVCEEIKGFRGEASLTTYVVSAIKHKIVDHIRKEVRIRGEARRTQEGTLETIKRRRFEELEKTLFVAEEGACANTDNEIALMELEQLLSWAIVSFLSFGDQKKSQQKNNAIVLRLLGFRFKEIERALSLSSDEAARSWVRWAVDEGGLSDMPPADEIKEILSENHFDSGQLEERLTGLLSGIEIDSCVLSGAKSTILSRDD